MATIFDNSTNLSITNCDLNDCNGCSFRNDLEPKVDCRRGEGINNSVMIQKYAAKNSGSFTDIKDFTPINSGLNGCSETVWCAADPRLTDSARAQHINLDKPPLDSTPNLKDIYLDSRLNKYGQDYKSYADITAGDIRYYIDPSISDPMIRPIFAKSANIDGWVYQDPMGGLNPQYVATPEVCADLLNTNRKDYDGTLSFLRDSSDFRENLIFSQMSLPLKMKWESRWGGKY